MASTSRLFLLLAAAAAAAAAFFLVAADGSVINEGCKHTDAHHDYCVEALSSVPKSKDANLHGLARIALSLTAKNASLTSAFVAQMHDKVGENDERLENCLAVCKEDYLDAVEQLDDAKGAFDKRKFADVVGWVKAAQEYVKYCQKECHDVPDNKNVLTQRNKDVRTLCSITISLTNLLH